MQQHCVAFSCVTMRCDELRYVTLRCVELLCIALRCVALRYVTHKVKVVEIRLGSFNLRLCSLLITTDGQLHHPHIKRYLPTVFFLQNCQI